MPSPFPYDRLPTPDQFFGRKEELRMLSTAAQHGNNLLIYSKRRMGKSALIGHFLDQNRQDYLTLYVDIFDITSKEEFAYAMLKALSNARKLDLKEALKTFASLLKRVRLEPTIDPHTLEYTIRPVVATLSFEEMMEDFFHAIYELSKKERIIIAIDEFQQIASLGELRLDAFLRKHIQARSNTSYFFLGSKRHLLTSLFEYQAPLYEMASHHSLAPLALEDVYTYSQKHLPITESVCAYLYERSDGETKMMQQILHGLYIRQPEAITQDDVDSVIEEILIAKDTSYRLLFDTLTNNQKLALKLIAKHRSGLFSAALLAQHHIKKQTLQSAIDALFKRELIDKEREGYFIPDRTLELWAEKISR